MRSMFSNTVRLFLSIVLLFSLYKLIPYFYGSFENKELYESLFAEKETSANQIEDLVGWLQIPNTNIDYPVVQTGDNEFYLTHNVLKEESRHGSIFMDYRNAELGSDKHTIIYGHNMKDGSMFKDLLKYKDEEFFDSNRILYVQSADGSEQTEWRIFSTYVVNDDFHYIETEFENDQEFVQFIEQLISRSMYQNHVEVNADDEIMTLSTCSNETENARYVVHAKKVQ